MSIKSGIALTGVQCGTTAISNKEGYLVKFDTSYTSQIAGVTLSGLGDPVIGVVADALSYVAGDNINLIGRQSDIVQVKAGTAGFSAGDYVKSDASGLGITASGSDTYFAIALQTATSGQLGYVMLITGGINASVSMWTRAATTIRPTTTGDTIATGVVASDAAILSMTTNNIASGGTGANVDLKLSSKGTGKVTAGVAGSELPVLTAPTVGLPVIATTGTAGTAGQVSIAGLTANAVYNVTLAEDPGTNLVLAYCVASAGILSVYTRNTNTDAAALLSGKKVSVVVYSL